MKNLSQKIKIVLVMMVILLSASCQRDKMFNDQDENVTVKSIKTVHNLSMNSVLQVDLLAGKHILAGTLNVSFDADFLYVAYQTTNGWMLDEVHLWLGATLSGLPKTPSGNPIIGHFPYKADNLNGITSYEFVIPLTAIGGYPGVCDMTFFIAAHAAVRKEVQFNVFQTETAWADGIRITSKGNWGTYFGFTFDCDTTTVISGCETGFAFGSTTFSQAGIGNNWGWIYTLTSEGSFSTPIYAGASQNNINNGVHVGMLDIVYMNGLLEVTFNMFSGYVLQETQLYASTSYPTTAAPGLYGNNHPNLNNAGSDYYSLQISGLPVYIIAHAVVCEDVNGGISKMLK